jgi:hypothetical protein
MAVSSLSGVFELNDMCKKTGLVEYERAAQDRGPSINTPRRAVLLISHPTG